MPPTPYRNLDETKVSKELLQALRQAFTDRSFPIYLAGPVGVGKSFAAALVYTKINCTVTMACYCDLINTAIEAERTGEVHRTLDSGQVIEMTKGQWWHWLETVGLVIVDEIGTGLVNEWRTEMLWRLLEIRKHKPLLMTGNIGINAIGEQFDQRIQSRLIEGTIVQLDGKDKRRTDLEKRMKRITV